MPPRFFFAKHTLYLMAFVIFAFAFLIFAAPSKAQENCKDDACKSAPVKTPLFRGRIFNAEQNLFAETSLNKKERVKKTFKAEKKSFKSLKAEKKKNKILSPYFSEPENHSKDFKKTSTIIHFLIGLALFLSGIFKFYAQQKRGKSENLKYIPSLALSLAGFLPTHLQTG